MKTSSIIRVAGFWVACTSAFLQAFAGKQANLTDSLPVIPFSMNVVFVEFQARPGGQGHQISWTTILETNLSHYEIERSNSGQSFQSIATVKAQGSGGLAVPYTFTDKHPLPGNNIYRLKMVDTRGGSKLSEHKIVNGNGQVLVSAAPMVYPNPVRPGAAVRINVPESGNYQVRLLNLQGKVLQSYTREQKDGMGFSVDIPAQAGSGIYILDLYAEDGGQHWAHKVVLQ